MQTNVVGCTNVMHNEIDCLHSDLSIEQWCEKCRSYSRAFVVAWKTPSMATHAYSCYRVRENADRRLTRFQQEFPGGVIEVVEIEASEGFVYSDGVL